MKDETVQVPVCVSDAVLLRGLLAMVTYFKVGDVHIEASPRVARHIWIVLNRYSTADRVIRIDGVLAEVTAPMEREAISAEFEQMVRELNGEPDR